MKKHKSSVVLNALVHLSAGLSVGILVWIVGYIFWKGIPHLNPGLFSLTYNSENLSVLPAFVSTVIMVIIGLLLAVPVGVLAAVYLHEYATPGNRLVAFIRLSAEMLSGLPSIVYGLFGFLLFVVALKMGYSIIGGGLTLAVMVLPIIMSTTEEALKSVPVSYREGSFGLGAGKYRTIFAIVLPAAAPGIISGIVLSAGRMIGETAALLYTAGTVAGIPGRLTDSARTLSVHMYLLSSEGMHMDQAYATAVVLLVLVIAMNVISDRITGMITRSMK